MGRRPWPRSWAPGQRVQPRLVLGGPSLVEGLTRERESSSKIKQVMIWSKQSHPLLGGSLSLFSSRWGWGQRLAKLRAKAPWPGSCHRRPPWPGGWMERRSSPPPPTAPWRSSTHRADEWGCGEGGEVATSAMPPLPFPPSTFAVDGGSGRVAVAGTPPRGAGQQVALLEGQRWRPITLPKAQITQLLRKDGELAAGVVPCRNAHCDDRTSAAELAELPDRVLVWMRWEAAQKQWVEHAHRPLAPTPYVSTSRVVLPQVSPPVDRGGKGRPPRHHRESDQHPP